MGTVLLGHVETEISEEIRASAVDWPSTNISEVTKLETILARLGAGEDPIDALVLGTVFDDPVRVAQVVHSRDRDLSVLILNDPSNGDQLKQSVQFSPFLGPEICCWPKSPVDALTGALGIAVTRTRQRRRYRDLVEASKPDTKELCPSVIPPAEYLDRLLDHAPIGVALLDERRLTAALNRRARELLEISEREALGRSLRDFLLPTDTDRLGGFLARCASSIHTAPPERFDRTLHDGTAQSLEMTGTAISSSSGHQCVMVIFQDVTERALAERHQRRLMDELDHRVKNNLTMVIALADQTLAGAATPDEFARAFKGRIHALARVHEALAAARWEGVDLVEIIHMTMEPFARDAWHRIGVHGGPLLLPARAASILCMTLHELATNAMKYGALSNTTGSIGVTWARDADGRTSLGWVESGGPPVSVAGTSGFGSEVIKGLVRHELAGDVDLDFNAAGLRCSITFPPPSDDAPPR